MPVIGLRGSLGIGVESTAGTAVSATTTMPASNLSVMETSTQERGTDLTVNTGGVQTTVVELDRRVAGTTECALHYNAGVGLLLYAWFGAVSEGGGGGPTYDHTFTLSAPESLPSVTLVQTHGNSGNKHVVNGCVANTLELVVSSAASGRISIGWIGRAQETITTASNPTVTAGTKVLGSHGALTWNSTTYTGVVSEAKVTGNNNLAAGWTYGSLTAGYILPSGPREIALETKLVCTAAQWDALMDARRALTESNAVLTFTSGSLVLAITLHNASVESVGMPITGAGVVSATVKFRGRGDGSNGGLAAVLTNTNATYEL